MVRDMVIASYRRCGVGLPVATFDRLCSGTEQLWVSIDGGIITACLVTRIDLVDDGRAKAVVMVACGGAGMKVWAQCHDQIEDFARAEGCDRVRTDEARPGWAKVLGPGGYRVTHVTLEKRIDRRGQGQRADDDSDPDGAI